MTHGRRRLVTWPAALLQVHGSGGCGLAAPYLWAMAVMAVGHGSNGGQRGGILGRALIVCSQSRLKKL